MWMRVQMPGAMFPGQFRFGPEKPVPQPLAFQGFASGDLKAAVGTPVFVYRNLHKGCWSVRSVKTDRVVGHPQTVALTDATFKVSQAGRERVLRERRKNVHAGVQGTLAAIDEVSTARLERKSGTNPFQVTYNPYRFDRFVRVTNTEPVQRADYVFLKPTGCWVAEVSPKFTGRHVS